MCHFLVTLWDHNVGPLAEVVLPCCDDLGYFSLFCPAVQQTALNIQMSEYSNISKTKACLCS